MNEFLGFLFGAVTLAGGLIFSIGYLVAKKYMETLAKLSAEDYYESKVK